MDAEDVSPSKRQQDFSSKYAKDSSAWQQDREYELRLNSINNVYSAYCAIYELFKKWHCEVVEERNVVGPDKSSSF